MPNNADIEARHSTLEFELRAVEHFTTKQAARAKVAAWIEDYKPTRKSGWLPPIVNGSRTAIFIDHGRARSAPEGL